MGRIVCFVEVYSELVCLHSVKFCVYETSLSRTFGKGQLGVWTKYSSIIILQIELRKIDSKEQVHTIVHIPGAIIPLCNNIWVWCIASMV